MPSFEALRTILHRLETVHTSLLRIAYDKTAVIKSGDTTALDQLIKDEQAHLAAIIQLDKQRQETVIQCLQQVNQPIPAAPTIADVVAFAPVDEQHQLEEARDRLLHAIHDLKFQNDLNQQLTFQSLQFVNLSLDMVRPRQDAVTYSKKEVAGQAQSKENSSFDSQA